jgi:hypothetical protein
MSKRSRVFHALKLQKGTIKDDLELTILPISFQLQEEHAKNFVNVHCFVEPTADCSMA